MACQARFDRKEGSDHDYCQNHDAQHHQRKQEAETGSMCVGPGGGLWRRARQGDITNMSWGWLRQAPGRVYSLNVTLLPFASGLGTHRILNTMKSLFAYTAVLFAVATLSAAVVTGGGTGTGTTTPTTPVLTPTKPTSGSCQKPESRHEKKGEKKSAPKPAPIKSAAPVCKKR